MKIVILLAVLCVISNAEYTTTLGDCENFPQIGRSRAYEKAYKNTIRTKVIKFPMVKKHNHRKNKTTMNS